MYHEVPELLVKLDAIAQKTSELRHLIEYIGSQKIMVDINTDRLESDKDYLIADIQSLCRDIANDKGGKDG